MGTIFGFFGGLSLGSLLMLFGFLVTAVLP